MQFQIQLAPALPNIVCITSHRPSEAQHPRSTNVLLTTASHDYESNFQKVIVSIKAVGMIRSCQRLHPQIDTSSPQLGTRTNHEAPEFSQRQKKLWLSPPGGCLGNVQDHDRITAHDESPVPPSMNNRLLGPHCDWSQYSPWGRYRVPGSCVGFG